MSPFLSFSKLFRRIPLILWMKLILILVISWASFICSHWLKMTLSLALLLHNFHPLEIKKIGHSNQSGAILHVFPRCEATRDMESKNKCFERKIDKGKHRDCILDMRLLINICHWKMHYENGNWMQSYLVYLSNL